MKRTEFKENGDEWCELEIELCSRAGKGLELSICGSYGQIETLEDAEDMAKESWLDFFDDDTEFGAFVKRFPDVSTVEDAAQFILDTDGEFFGLDVYRENGDRIYLMHGGGQCIEEIKQWFPEVKPYLQWHLNGMRAGCVHQESMKRDGFNFGISEPCPVCGYEYGTEWKHEDLPQEVIDWAKGS